MIFTDFKGWDVQRDHEYGQTSAKTHYTLKHKVSP